MPIYGQWAFTIMSTEYPNIIFFDGTFFDGALDLAFYIGRVRARAKVSCIKNFNNEEALVDTMKFIVS